MELAWLAAFGTAVLYAASSLFEDHAAKSQPTPAAASGRSLVGVTTRPAFLIGIVLSLAGWFLSLLALQRLPLFAVQAIGASSIGIVVVANRLMTHAQPAPHENTLLVALGVGLVALAVAAEPDEPSAVSDAFVVGMWIGVVLLIGLMIALLRAKGGAHASAMLGVISGLGYGGTALCARALQTDHTVRGILLDPLTIALVPFAVVGVVSFAAALQRGSVGVATATQHAAMTVVPSAVGLLVLGDHSRPGFEPVALLGFVLTVGAVLALTLWRSPTPAPTAAVAG